VRTGNFKLSPTLRTEDVSLSVWILIIVQKHARNGAFSQVEKCTAIFQKVLVE